MRKHFEKIAEHRKHVLNTARLYTRIDQHEIPIGENEIRLFAIARNESLRLSYFLDYYFRLGVNRVFLIDNGSTDDTREIAMQHPNVHVFRIDDEFKNFWYWIEFFLQEYGKHRWCIVADIDELLSFPLVERLNLRQLVQYLEDNRFTALKALLLDMYANTPISEAHYQPGSDPLKICRYFDLAYKEAGVTFFDKSRWQSFQYTAFFGGMRQRVFAQSASGETARFCLSKIPLLKYSDETYLTEGMHAVNGANIADIQGVVFHTKFLADFVAEAKEEAERQQHFNNAADYKVYDFHLREQPRLTLMHAKSVEYKNSLQLLRLGLMKAPISFLFRQMHIYLLIVLRKMLGTP